MKDIIVGRVAEVIDAEIIDVEVTQVIRNRHDEYFQKEYIRAKAFLNGSSTYKNIKNKSFLEYQVKGKGVMCLVMGRDSHGCIEADVYTL